MKIEKGMLAAVAATAVVTVAATLTACSQTNQIEVTGTTSGTTSGSQQGTGGGPGVSGAAFKTPGLMGTITAVKDGKVTLKLMKIQSFPGGQAPGGGGQGGASGPMPAGGAQSGANQPPTGSGQPPAGGQGGGSMPSLSGQSGAGNKMGVQYTGKTKTITLTSSTKIVSQSFGQPNTSSSASSSEKTVSLSSLKKGETLMVYYKTDKKTIDYVSVRTNEKPGKAQQTNGASSTN